MLLRKKEEKLAALEARLKEEVVCSLKTAGNHITFGRGNVDASIVFISHGPMAKDGEVRNRCNAACILQQRRKLVAWFQHLVSTIHSIQQ